MHPKRNIIFLFLFVSAFTAGPASNLQAQAGGWTGGWEKIDDHRENAFTLDVPRGWSASGGAYRFGYGDVRAMVDVWSSDGRTNLRFGDIWFTAPYAVPNRFHREGEAQDLGAVGRGTYAEYRTGEEFAELYAQRTFRGVCRSLTPQRVESPTVRDTSMHRRGNTQFSEGEVAYRCESRQGPRIAYAYAKTTQTTAPGLANAPAFVSWTPQLVSYLAPPDQVAVAQSIVRHFWASFKLKPRWVQYQNEMDRQGVAYAVARAQGRITQIQAQFASSAQRINDQVSRFQEGQARQQKQVDSFLLILNGQTPTDDPTHPTVPQGTHAGKWNCGGRIIDSDLSPGPNCVRIK